MCYAATCPHDVSMASAAIASIYVVNGDDARRAISNSLRAREAAGQRVANRQLGASPAEHREALTAAAVRAAETDHHEAWTDVVEGAGGLVTSIASTYFVKWASYLPAHGDFDTVHAAGLEGLVVAVRKFDPSKGFAFSTYATHWIRTKAQRACYAQCSISRIPEDLLRAGMDPLDPIISSNAISAEYRATPSSAPIVDTVADTREPGDEIVDGAGVSHVLAILRGIDANLPEVAQWLERGYADREIGRLVGITARRVDELRRLAADALTKHGLCV